MKLKAITKNKTFIAKEGNTHEVEKNVANKAPVDKIEMSNLNIEKSEVIEKLVNSKVSNIHKFTKKRKGGTKVGSVAELVSKLKNEAKVI